MRSTTIKILLSTVGTILFLSSASAADNKVAAKAADASVTLYVLVGLMIILLFVIGMLAHTLKQLTAAVREKNARNKQNADKVAVALALFFAGILPATAHAADSTKAYQLPQVIDGIAFNDFCFLVGAIILELLGIFFLAINIQLLLKVLKGEVAGTVVKPVRSKSWFWDKFNKAATVEQEKDILLDHNYDGIQELDNSLPPWWKYGFYLTILVGIIYIYRYHVAHTGLSQLEEFAQEMQKGEEEKAAYLALAANKIDETNVKALTDPDALAAGKEVFLKNCAACHVADGGGNVGPNLTDEYWLHGGSIQDIFKSIKYGWQDKGMKSWKDDLSPSQIQQVASFIKSLKGTHPAAPKPPQGDLYVEVAKTDSTVAVK